MEFNPGALDDLTWWAEQDRAQTIRVIRLVRETQRDPFAGSAGTAATPVIRKHLQQFAAYVTRKHSLEFGQGPSRIQ
jgi:Txe/YoeB family toxin of Txe-Axe toxin-antitoxin module